MHKQETYKSFFLYAELPGGISDGQVYLAIYQLIEIVGLGFHDLDLHGQ